LPDPRHLAARLVWAREQEYATAKARLANGDVDRPLLPSEQAQLVSAELSRRVEKVVGYPPLSEMGAGQRREFQEALLDASGFEDLPGKWQAAVLAAEQNRPSLRVVEGE
jgi:hypothetical protein